MKIRKSYLRCKIILTVERTHDNEGSVIRDEANVRAYSLEYIEETGVRLVDLSRFGPVAGGRCDHDNAGMVPVIRTYGVKNVRIKSNAKIMVLLTIWKRLPRKQA